MRYINLIVIHCSASPNGVYISPAQIDAWHAARGFARGPYAASAFNQALPHIGYHWVVTADGRQHAGRATDEIGAHVFNHNKDSIGICMTGTDRFYRSQWETLANLICDIAYNWQQELLLPKQRIKYPLSPAEAIGQLNKMGISVVGHRDLSPDKNGDGKITSIDWLKTCPGFDVATWAYADMSPIGEQLLDEHPAIASHTGVERAINNQ